MSRFHAALAGVTLLLTLALAPALKGYRVDASTDSMVLEDDPESARYDRIAQMFVSDEFVLVGVNRSDLFEPSGIAAISSLHARFAAIAFVREIDEGSPAAQAGVALYDRIVELDGTPVRWAVLPELLQKASRGEPVKLVVLRLGKDERTGPVELTLTLPALGDDALSEAVKGAEEDELSTRRDAFVRAHLGLVYTEAVQSVLSITGVPLFRAFDPPLPPFQAIMRQAKLGQNGVDAALARKELTEHNLYANNIISRSGESAGILVTLRPLPESRKAVRTRLRLLDRRRAANAALSNSEGDVTAARAELKAVGLELEAFRPEWVRTEDLRKQERIRIVRAVREIVEERRALGEDMRASGVPALVVEMVEAIDGDLRVFTILSFVFLLGFLGLVFRRPRWVALPLLATSATVVWTIALMFQMGKRITVITSNVPSLLLVIGLAHSIHMIVRYRELLVRYPDDPTATRVRRMVRSLVWPCLFTATTTSAGFLSLQFAGSRPIIDFGVLMSVGVGLAFFLSFVFLPGFLLMLPTPREGRLERSARALQSLGRVSLARGGRVMVLAVLIGAVSVVGISKLDVEARFIDYFSADSPIHKGLTYIDQKLGGTSGLEVVLSCDEVGAFGWQHPQNLDRAAEVAEWFAARQEVGVVMSYVGLIDELRKTFPNAQRAQAATFLTNNLPIKLFKPYVLTEAVEIGGRKQESFSAVRIVARVRETDPNLRRGELLSALNAFLAERFPADGSVPEGLDAERFVPRRAEATGMFVLYANMLHSLIGSQIKTSIIAVVVIWLMLSLLFRNPFAAFLALIPNALPIVFVLGLMGWGSIPLDMATVMIASVSLGIGIDCAIHYLFRYREEVAVDGDVEAAILRSHGSIGTSIFYTSATTVVGFAVLAFSNFRPNAYFGVLTGFAMVAALFAMLTVLPVLIHRFHPFGKAMREGAAKGQKVPSPPTPDGKQTT